MLVYFWGDNLYVNFWGDYHYSLCIDKFHMNNNIMTLINSDIVDKN